MSEHARLQPLKRGPRKPRDRWSEVGTPHPGVSDPRSARISDWPPAVNAAIIATCAFITALAILSAVVASPVGTVERWNEWRTEGGEIHLEHPAGWAVRELDAPDQIFLVVMRSPWVRIHVISEPGLASPAGLHRQIGPGAHYQVLEHLHHATAETWERQMFGELEEGQTGRTIIGGRRAVWSQFTYAGRHLEQNVPMAGYRATIIGDDRGVIASAVAPSEHWSEFKPIALHVLRSIRLGAADG